MSQSAFNFERPYNELPDLPPKANLETAEIYRAVIQANRLLAELKGFCQTLPNLILLLNTILLQESKESSAIENIVTTQDELYKANLWEENTRNQAAKEVLQYRQAMYLGLEELRKNNLITANILTGIMQKLRGVQDNIRTTPSTKLYNPVTGQAVYTPPEGEDVIREKMRALEQFINTPDACELDPLIKMALIHYQFEAIHPFNDGNGRTGRILNILYLIQQGLIDLPVLYLSKYILEHRSEYYRLLRAVTAEGNWNDWVLYMVDGVRKTSLSTLNKIKDILALMAHAEAILKKSLGSAFSRELCDLIFSYPYIKISVLEKKGIAKRQTASKYLKKIEQAGLLRSTKVWKETYFINSRLLEVLSA